MIVYIAHAYGGDKDNLAEAKRYVKAAYEMGHAPLATWIIGCEVFPEGEAERERGLVADETIVRLADELWLCGDRVSDGMMRELRAFGDDKTVRRYTIVGGNMVEI